MTCPMSYSCKIQDSDPNLFESKSQALSDPLPCLKESKSKVGWKLAGPGEQDILFSFLVQFMLTSNFSISGLVKRASAFGDGSAEGFSSICLFVSGRHTSRCSSYERVTMSHGMKETW